jgi:hypothetical protein
MAKIRLAALISVVELGKVPKRHAPHVVKAYIMGHIWGYLAHEAEAV